MGDVYVVEDNSNSNNNNKKNNKKKKKNRGGTKKKMTHQQILALKCVSEWVFLDHPSSASASAASCVVDDFGVQKPVGRGGEKLLFELHSHSKFSDGFFSPTKVVERAHINGVSFTLLFTVTGFLTLVFVNLKLFAFMLISNLIVN